MISRPATSWATMAALNFVDFEQGGELLINSHRENSAKRVPLQNPL
jgi:hypothetical protein